MLKHTLLMSTDSRRLATSLFKALDALSMLSAREEGLAIREVVEGMGLPRSSLIRILDSLIHYGLVERGADKRYRVTGKFREWRISNRDEELVDSRLDFMKRIAGDIGEMAILGQLQGRMIRHLHYEEPDCRVRVAPPIGRKIPLERMAMGKWFADLANFDDVLGEGRWRGWLLATVYLVGFALYFPFATGIEVSRKYFDLLFFLPDWI